MSSMLINQIMKGSNHRISDLFTVKWKGSILTLTTTRQSFERTVTPQSRSEITRIVTEELKFALDKERERLQTPVTQQEIPEGEQS